MGHKQNSFGKKSLWKPRGTRFDFFCPQCRAQRTLPFHPKRKYQTFVIRTIILTAFLMLVCWPLMGWKGIVWLLPISILSETYYRLRVRGHLPCPHCGFDPYLYMQSADEARGAMTTFWKGKFKERGFTYPGEPVAEQQNKAPEDQVKQELDA